MPEELSERLGARTVSRLEEMCGEPVPLFGEDLRRVRFAGAIPPPSGERADHDRALPEL